MNLNTNKDRLRINPGDIDAGRFDLTGEIIGSDLICPSKANVVPHYDWDFDGTNQYTVCHGRTNTQELTIFGNPSRPGEAFCVIPVLKSQDTSGNEVLNPYRDPRIELPADPDMRWVAILSHCMMPSEEGVLDQYPGTLYNALVIVERSYLDEMKQCLAAHNETLCPRIFSFGTIQTGTLN